MGRLQDQEMVGMLDIDTALHWHLQYNHYPPIHESFIEVAKQAIEYGNNEDWYTVLDLPNGKQLKVWEVIEGMHLDSFLDSD